MIQVSPASLYDPRNLSQLTRRLRSLGLSGQHARKFCWFLHRQIQAQGMGAIAYLKRLSNSILQFLTGEKQQSEWIATYKGFPRSIKYLRKYSRNVLFRLTRVHAFVTLSQVTASQASKFMEAVRTPQPSEDSLRSARQFITDGVDRFVIGRTCQNKLLAFPLALVPLQRQSRNGSLRQLSGKRKAAASIETSGNLILRSLDYLASPVWFDTLVNPYVQDAFYPLDKGYFGQLSELYSAKLSHAPSLAKKIVEKIKIERYQPSLVGNLGFSQEPGGKLRVFASPFPIWQAVCEPLGVRFLDILKFDVGQDCTHNQEEGAIWAQAQLRAGKSVHSVDLSNATDLFPLKLQELCLTEKFGIDSKMRDIFLRIAKGNWKVPKAIREFGYPEEISWERGQPLGLKPSFGLFAFTHHMLIQGMCHELGVPLDSYRVLGDDVIFSDIKLSHTYITVMEQIGCKIAHEKSILSNKMAEFAGYRITPEEYVRPGKFRKLSLTNVVEVAKVLGNALKHEVSEKVHSFLERYLSLPKEYGGADLNLSDCSELVMHIEETRAEKLKDCAGDLLEQRCARAVLASGVVDRIPEHSLKNSRFNQFITIINYGLENRILTSAQIKQYGVSWAIGVVEAVETAKLCDRSREGAGDTAIRLRYGIPLSADLTTAKLRINRHFQRYYASVVNLNNHKMLIEWMKKDFLSRGEAYEFQKDSKLLR